MVSHEIIIGGEYFPVNADVLYWNDHDGLNGYDMHTEKFCEDDRKKGTKTKVIKGRRYTKTIGDLGKRINKVRGFVIHHTGGFTAKQCFQTLHNRRKLSAQFIIEDNGIVFQTLDALEIAWHAGKANKFYCGAECVLYPDAQSNPDAYRPQRQEKLGVASHDTMEQYIQGKKRTVFKMPEVQVNALAEVVAAYWVARYKHTKSKMLDLTRYWDVAPPYFMSCDMYQETERSGQIDFDYNKKSLNHTGLLLHANLSPRKWDAAGIDYAHFEQLAGLRFYEMIKARG